ncbi:MAG: hypothetical protein JJE29_06045 [Peptostreptococcaceae bacterium]|nr:hypothetical protein [Peptostreptococcaceae bacterium]
MEKKYLIASLSILVIVAAIFGGVRYYSKSMPQVSATEANGYFAEYSTSLVDRYNELNDEHEIIANLSSEDWKEFSAAWIAKLSESRPEELLKRLPDEFESDSYRFSKSYENLLRLWQEYNDEVIEGKLRQEKQTELKDQIEDLLELK